MTDTKEFARQVVAACSRHAALTRQMREQFETALRSLSSENLIAPRWFHADKRMDALAMIERLEVLVDELIAVYKQQTLAFFADLTNIECELDARQRRQFLAEILDKLNAAHLQFGAFFALQKRHLGLTRKLFEFVEQRSDQVSVEAHRIRFERDADVGRFNGYIDELTATFEQIGQFGTFETARLRDLAAKMGIADLEFDRPD